MKKNDLGNRMKENYEKRSQSSLLRRTPVILRIDGKAFSQFCKRFDKPYDVIFNESMNKVMKYLCENIQGAKFAERHSDEISILLTDYDNINTEAYFDYQVQKISSVVASLASSELCRVLFKEGKINIDEAWPSFDCRCFNIPEHEICNYFLWRQQDALRNGLSMLARSYFSHKQLNNKNGSDMQEMLFSEHGINWNDYPQERKTGFVCLKKSFGFSDNGKLYHRWMVRHAPRDQTELKEVLEQAINPVE